MVRLSRGIALAALAAWPAARVDAQFPAREYAERRDALAARLGGSVIVVFGAPEPKHDYLEFHQAPGMLYLTGVREPNAALVMVQREGRATQMLFVEPSDPMVEVWSGRRMGLAGATRATGIQARPSDEFRSVLDSLAATGMPWQVIGDFAARDSLSRSQDQQVVAAVRTRFPAMRVSVANGTLDRMRGRKSPREIALLRRAAEITVIAHRAAMQAVHAGMNEFEIEALIEYEFRRNGAERPAFASIVGSGPNSTILHYNADDRFTQAGETIVIDVGASYKGYAADVTRTIPASGVFSPEQRQIYQIVRDAQAAAERQARPGARAQIMSDSASSVLAAGLARLGLIESPEATFDCTSCPSSQMPQLFLYYMHGLGHGIGLEVHDPEQFYFTGTLAPGSAFTIEPGIYVAENVLERIPDTPRNRALIAKLRPAVQKYKNIGVRIEDDYVITDAGLEWISPAPREIAEVEQLMRTRAMPAGRNADLVRAFRDTLPER